MWLVGVGKEGCFTISAERLVVRRSSALGRWPYLALPTHAVRIPLITFSSSDRAAVHRERTRIMKQRSGPVYQKPTKAQVTCLTAACSWSSGDGFS